MRFAPKPVTALVVFVVYLVVFYGVWIVNGIEYAHISDNATTLLKWYVAPLAGGAVVLLVAITVLGWWRPVVIDAEQHTPPRWMWLAPVVTLAIAVLFLATKDFSGVTASMWPLLALGSIGVGFCEEAATRGVLLTGFRARMSEVGVWFWTSLLFGALHLPNAFFGLGLGALGQTLLAFCVGSTFYVLRRLTGSLVHAMVLHGFWDFSTFAGEMTSNQLIQGLVFVNALAGLVVGIVLARRSRGLRIPNTREGAHVATA